MNKLKNKKQGFTIIEVVLVLAIAGLIFLIVFLALPRLQKNRRDTQRKTDLGTILSQLEQRAGNSQSTYPVADNAGFVTGFGGSYISDLKDPKNSTVYASVGNVLYGPAVAGVGGNDGLPGTTPGNIRYANPGKCGTDGAIVSATGTSVAVSMRLESGVACQGNQ